MMGNSKGPHVEKNSAIEAMCRARETIQKIAHIFPKLANSPRVTY